MNQDNTQIKEKALIPELEIQKSFLTRPSIPSVISDYYFNGKKYHKFERIVMELSKEKHEALQQQISEAWDKHLLTTVLKGLCVKSRMEPGTTPDEKQEYREEEARLLMEQEQVMENIRKLSKEILESEPVNVPVYSWIGDRIDADCKRSRLAWPEMIAYQTGFYKGYESSFVPFIDTADNRKELVMKEVSKAETGFPRVSIHKRGDDPIYSYDSDAILKYGEQVGRVYKAWEIVFENPLFFELEFRKMITSVREPNKDDSAITDEKIDTLLTADGLKILPLLNMLVKGKQKQYFAAMVFALYELELLKVNPVSNQTRLHRAIKGSFGSITDIGSRQNLSTYIVQYNAPSDEQRCEIESVKNVIENFLIQNALT